MEILSGTKTYNFLGKRYYAYIFSLVVTLASVYLWVSKGDEKFGTDFSGGHEIIVGISGQADSESIRNALNREEFKDVVVQSFEAGSSQYSIRLGGSEDAKTVRSNVEKELKAAFPDRVEILRTDYVGPTIGKELRTQALWAAIIGLAAIVLYVTYRYEWAFALGALVSLFHDLAVAIGVYLFFDHAINMAALAGVLTILGYSVNDTIIVFDRMREEILKKRGESFDLEHVMNYSVSITLSRTIITSMLTLFSAAALLFFGGGGAIEDLNLMFVPGIITGTYSSIFIASAIALDWSDFQSWIEKRRAKTSK